ncbi:MAG: AsmA-like C-terminal region-containing protein [Flavobacteriales bacterium]|nr:AsmA-like C-terminal region-containing protein [Flavobacteriales bacterium]
MKKFVRILLYSSAFLLVAVAAMAWWVSTHEEELKERALSTLNEGLLTEMQIDTLSYSFFAHFPNASLQCQNVILFDTFEDRDTLLWADELSLEVSLFNLIAGDYRFDRVRISDGGMHMKRNSQGKDNYHFWKPSDDSDSSTVALALETVTLENINYVLLDEYAEVTVKTLHLDAEVTGNFAGDVMELDGFLDTPDALVAVAGKNWVPHLPLGGTLSSMLNFGEEVYDFPAFEILINDVAAKGSANFALLPEGVECTIDADLSDIALARVPEMLPAEENALLSAYAMNGNARASFTLSGLAGNGNTPSWKATGNLTSGSMEQIAEGVSLESISTSFEVQGGGDKKDQLIVRSFNASLEGGEVQFSGVWDDFAHPYINFDSEASIDLYDAQAFLGLDSIGQLDGDAFLTVHYKGAAPFLRNPSSAVFSAALKSAEVSGELSLNDASIALTALPRPFEQVQGRFIMLGDHADIQSLSMLVGGTDLALQGSLTNFIPWVMGEGATLYIDASCESDVFNLTSFVSSDESTSESDDDYSFTIPEHIVFNLNTSIREFAFREFNAANMSGLLRMDQEGIYFKDVACLTAGGSYGMNVSCLKKNSGFTVRAESQLEKIDVNRLFTSFENFGQDFIQAGNVRGNCTASATFQAHMSNAMKIDAKSIVSHIDLKLENGELIALQSMDHISQYMRENKLISPFVKSEALEEKLKHIHFATLENEIEIRDERIYFPTMDMHSSAMDITVSGSHWFNQSIDYSIALYLRDFLIQRDQSEFGEVEDDGLGNRFFLSMTGTTDDPSFGYDRLAKKEVRKQERQEEKENFKQMLQEEFKIFGRKDSSATQDKEPEKNNTGISVSWGDDEKEEKPAKGSETKPKEEKGKKRRWKFLKEDEEEEEVDISIDDDF